MAIRNVTHAQCQQWVEKRGAELSSSSFVQELDTLRLVLDYAVSRGLILSNPAKEIKRRKLIKAKIVVPSREQFQRLIDAMRDNDGTFGTQGKGGDAADLIELLAYSGARLAEGTALKWSDVDFARNAVTLTGGDKGTKNHEPRTIPMTSALREFLSKLKDRRKPKDNDLLSVTKDAKKCLQTTCKKLGCPHFTHHDFRHFFATTCIESGVDIPTISRWLGHKDGGALAMKVYGHLREEHSFAMIKKVSFGSAAPANGTTG
ncbi:MAG: site-specific integrase [Verrucomicrobia bacterium]|nr:site-specific integrase [Verrucomicrobiota bacterium]